MKFPTTFAKGGRSLWTAKIISQGQQNARRDSTFSVKNEGLFQAFVPKGASIESFSPEYILSAADELNGRPRKKLGYHTPEELFERFLDSVYAASGCGSIAQNGSQRLPS